MIRLSTLINEIKFGVGPDQDRPSGSKLVAVFDPSEQYRLHGKTHGLMSHAIKHLGEIRPDVMEKAIQLIISKIKSSDAVYKGKRGKIIGGLPESADIKKVALNTMDMVNDRIMNGEPLSNEEEYISKILSTITKIYKSEIEKIIDSAQNIDYVKSTSDFILALRKNPVVSFAMRYDNKNIEVFIDFKTGVAAFLSGGIVRTAFKPGRSSSRNRIKQYFSQSNKDIKNPVISNILGS